MMFVFYLISLFKLLSDNMCYYFFQNNEDQFVQALLTMHNENLLDVYLEYFLCDVRQKLSELSHQLWQKLSFLSTEEEYGDVTKRVLEHFKDLQSHVRVLVTYAARLDKVAAVKFHKVSILNSGNKLQSIEQQVLAIFKAVLFFHPSESFVKFVQTFYASSFRAFDAQQKSSEGK